MTAPVSQVLSEAADLLAPEGAWTQGVFARGKQQQPLHVQSPHATCFCMRGALVRVGAVDARDDDSPATRFIGFRSAAKMVDWNDRPGRTQAEVVAKLREAAALAKEQGR